MHALREVQDETLQEVAGVMVAPLERAGPA